METTQNSQSEFIDFFGCQIESTPEWDWGKVMIWKSECTESFAQKMIEIYLAFENKKDQLKSLRKRHKNLIKTFEQAQKTRAQTKDNYLKAIAVHQETANHYKRTVRAFEQLAKQNELLRKSSS